MYFLSESHELVQNWISRANRLLESNYDVGDALVTCANIKGDQDVKERGRNNYEDIRNCFIINNPGLSNETYEHAIRLGASKAVH